MTNKSPPLESDLILAFSLCSAVLRRSDCNLENKRQKLLKLLSRPRARVIHVYPSDGLLGRDTCKKVKGTVFLFYVGSSKKTSDHLQTLVRRCAHLCDCNRSV